MSGASATGSAWPGQYCCPACTTLNPDDTASQLPGASTARASRWAVLQRPAPLRWYQLTRPGYLFGVTEYDDGGLFGNAVRLAAGVIPYCDFAMVQPAGSMLLMAPVALLAKVTGTGWRLAACRVLTVGADTADVVLLGLLARHRGPVPVLAACGGYAGYPSRSSCGQWSRSRSR